MAKGFSRGKSSGGIGGSGIFGFFGTTINCQSTDKSYYCNIMKVFNLIIVFLILYYLASIFFPKRFHF